MTNAFIHETTEIDDQVEIGSDTKIWHFPHVLKNTIVGKKCNIGQNVVVGQDVRVGNNCKIQNNVSVYKGVTLEDDVFCGPSMVFTNVFNPRSAIRRMDEIRPTLVKKGASLGAEAVRILGAIPVFVDIDPDTFNISVEKLETTVLEFKKDNPLGLIPKAVIPVDLFGLPCDYDAINKIARKNDLVVIEDAAQSFGAEYKGRMAGGLGDIGCTSFFPAKPLGCYGDGGAVFIDSDEIAEKLISIRVHGKGSDKYDNVRLGLNGRIDTIQAAILLAKMKIFPGEIQKRREVAQKYTDLISSLQSREDIVLPGIFDGYKSAWAQYSLLAMDGKIRSSIQDRFKENGIPTAIYYPTPLHLQTAYKDLGYKKDDFPIAEDYAERIFSIPMHPYLKKQEQQRVAEQLT